VKLRNQWVICPTAHRPSEIPNEWISVLLNDTHVLYYHPDLCVFQFRTATHIALFLGIVTDSETRPELIAPSELECDVSFARRLDNLSGTYCAIRITPWGAWLYTDPAALMGIYYSTTYISSTPALIFDRVHDAALQHTNPLQGTDDWYTGSKTPFSNVKMLLANHRLELETHQIQRFWPRTEFPLISYQASIEAIASHLKRTVNSLADTGKCVLSLTGGHDSRVNLAAAKEVIDRIQFFTIVGPKIKKCDQVISKALAHRNSLQYKILDDTGSDQSLLEFYDEISSGMALGARRAVLNACDAVGGKDILHINGNLGAITKSYFWHNKNPMEVSRKHILKSFTAPSKVLDSGLNEWMDTVPELPASTIYNLMYLEQRGGKWMSPGENASNIFYASVAPFNSREIFAAVCGIPNQSQFSRNILEDLVSRLWPELLNIPYCPQTRKLSTLLPKRFINWIKDFNSQTHRISKSQHH
jgi:hypothetical protein